MEPTVVVPADPNAPKHPDHGTKLNVPGGPEQYFRERTPEEDEKYQADLNAASEGTGPERHLEDDQRDEARERREELGDAQVAANQADPAASGTPATSPAVKDDDSGHVLEYDGDDDDDDEEDFEDEGDGQPDQNKSGAPGDLETK